MKHFVRWLRSRKPWAAVARVLPVLLVLLGTVLVMVAVWIHFTTAAPAHHALPCTNRSQTDLVCLYGQDTQVKDSQIPVQLGVDRVYLPRPSLDRLGITGISPVSSQCVAIFNRFTATSIQRLSVTVVSRYDASLSQHVIASLQNASPRQIHDFLVSERSQCNHTPSPRPATSAHVEPRSVA